MVTNKNVHGKLFFWNTLHHRQHYTWQPRSADVTHESASLQNQIQVTDAPFLPKFAQAISETLCEPLPPSTKLPDNLLYDLAIISVLDLRGRKKKKKVKGENTGCGHVNVSDWECQRSHGMQRSRCLAFTKSALNELINIHWPALANVPSDEQNKVAEVAHFTRGEKAGWEERGRKWAMQRKWAELIRGGRFRGREKKKREGECKEKQTPKGQSLEACRGFRSLLRLESETHKTCRGNVSAEIKTHRPVENKQKPTQIPLCMHDMTSWVQWQTNTAFLTSPSIRFAFSVH